jgi:hypothetical protein
VLYVNTVCSARPIMHGLLHFYNSTTVPGNKLHRNKGTVSHLLCNAVSTNGLNWLHIETLVIVLIQLLEHKFNTLRFAIKVFVLHVIVNDDSHNAQILINTLTGIMCLKLYLL